MSADKKLEEMGVELPPPPASVGVYKPAITVGNLCHTSGHVPLLPDGTMIKGCVGKDGKTTEDGYQSARQCGLAMLATLKVHLGSLDKIKRVVKIVGMVNSVPEFEEHPAVVNGVSELFREINAGNMDVGR